MILLLLAWTFWQNPSENYGQMVAYPSMWNHVTEVLSYYLPGFFGPLLHFVMVVKPLGIAGILVIYFVMFKWRKCLLRQSRGASQEIRKLVLAGSSEMANPPPGAGQTWCQKPQFLGNPSWWGWLFLLVSLFMVGMNGLFALTIRDGQVFSKTGKTIFKNQESGQALSDCGMATTPVEVQSTKYWNRSKVHLVAGGKYRIVTADPQQTWFDANKEATAMGWNTWYKRSNTHFRLISRLWARAPDYPLYRLMGVVTGPCQYGRRCPVQFPIPWPQALERSAEFVAPASGELLLYANDLPFMYWNNGQHPEQTTIRFTIQKMNCGAIANPHWQ
jgi:hypothetical protein